MTYSESAAIAPQHLFCPLCGTENVRDEQYCDRCGERVAGPDLSRRRPEELGRCARCETITLSHAKYCVGCGVSLIDTNPLPYAQPESATATEAVQSGVSTERPPRATGESSIRSGGSGTPSTSYQRRHVNDEWPFPRQPQHAADDIRTVQIGSSTSAARAPHQQEESNSSGHAQAKLPSELKAFNWGAFLLGPIWGIGNKVWITLPLLVLWLIPIPTSSVGMLVLYVGAYYAIALLLGFKGNELAWRSKKWASNEHFQHNQQLWARWGLAINAIVLLLFLVPLMRGASGA